MAATVNNPTVYSVYLISDGKKYDLTPAVESLDRIEAEGQISQRVVLGLRNVLVDGIWLTTALQPVSRLFVYADDGEKKEEVFRGFLWDRNYTSSLTEHTLRVTAYDNLIYMQESEDTFFFSSGKTTEEVLTSICKDWGIQLEYTYDNIVNGKLALSGRLYDMMTADVLDVTRSHTGNHYSLISDKDVMRVRLAGDNEERYKFTFGENVVSTSSGWTMEGMITQIVLVGKADDNDREPVDLVESRNESQYGTLQKIERKNEELDIWSAHNQVRTSLMENSEPKWEYEITCPDIPWIRKGDAVYVHAGDIYDKTLIVTAVNRSSDIKTSKMILTMVSPKLYKLNSDEVDWEST